MRITIQKEIILMDYLLENYPRKISKSMLSNKKIKINGKIITKYNYLLKENDILEINENKYDELEILYEDKDIIAVNKPYNLLTVATIKDDNTLYHQVSQYVKKQNKTNKIFIVHRLDKETSGIVVFAKSEKIKNILQDNWNILAKERIYTAIVLGKVKNSGTIATYLKESKTHQVYVSDEGKLGITHYKKIKSNNKYSLIEIKIETGRKNQIRVHLNYMGNPILGDLKYGKTKADRMYLHACKLLLIHPITNKEIEIISDSYFDI